MGQEGTGLDCAHGTMEGRVQTGPSFVSDQQEAARRSETKESLSSGPHKESQDSREGQMELKRYLGGLVVREGGLGM